VADCGVREGTVTVISRHTTTAIIINEWESRLVADVSTSTTAALARSKQTQTLERRD